MRRFLAPWLGLVVVFVAGSVRADEDPRPWEVTDVARLFPRHMGATHLYLNFDGWEHYGKKGHTIYPFVPLKNKREQEIQEILFRVSEIYAPFDVEIKRLTGSGRYENANNATTVFVGGSTESINKEGKKVLHGWTPNQYLDAPGKAKGDNHRPDSDPYHLAFVDPMVDDDGHDKWISKRSPYQIAGSIAHEAGHTFGLYHVKTSKLSEIMSYDAPNMRITNQVFPVTEDNFDPIKAGRIVQSSGLLFRWHGQTILKQNSFTYLAAVLGLRKSSPFARIADPTSVDPAFADGRLLDIKPGSTVKGALFSLGEYHVYRLQPGNARDLAIEVKPVRDSKLNPVLLLFDASGRRLLHYAHGVKGSRFQYQFTPRQAYKLVVGAFDGNSRGAFELDVRRENEK